MKIRYRFIENEVLQLFRILPSISFPLDVEKTIEQFVNCRCMSYQQCASISGCSVDEIAAMCDSETGCTHYDLYQDRYLVMWNESNNPGRQRWTMAHELGHILCKHFPIAACDKLSENGIAKIENPEFEKEADYFASCLLAPFPLFEILGIKSANDIQITFGLSREASRIRFNEYTQWNARNNIAWCNDLKKVYKARSS